MITGKFKIKLKISSKSREKKSKTGLSLLSAFFYFLLKIKKPKRQKAGIIMTTKEFEKGRTNAKKEIKNENPFRIFENEKFGELEVFMEEGIVWIEASKSAEILGYKNPQKAIKDHCVAGEHSLTIRSVMVNSGFGPRTIKKKYISEGNLYRLIARSKLPSAIEFEKWIFDVVVPSIRKYGYYSNEIPKISRADELMLKVMKSRSEEELLSNMAIYNLEVVIPLEKELEIARPKVETYNEFLDAEGAANTTTIVKSFGLPSGRLLNEIMHFEGFIVKVGNGWGPAKKYVDAGIMKPIEFSYNNQKSQSKLEETSDNKNKNILENSEVLLIEENKIAEIIETAEMAIIENKNEVSNIHQNKGLTFRWTLTGIEAIKEILLSKNYIVKNGNIYSANDETLKEFKKKYKEWKEKK